jgi:hypothetical protein
VRLPKIPCANIEYPVREAEHLDRTDGSLEDLHVQSGRLLARANSEYFDLVELMDPQ